MLQTLLRHRRGACFRESCFRGRCFRGRCFRGRRFTSSLCGLIVFILASVIVTTASAPRAWAINVEGALNGALDQPRINLLVRVPGQTDPLDGETFDPLDPLGPPIPTWNIEGFYDTGASAILLAPIQASDFGAPIEPGWQFTDVGVAGSANFNITQPLTFQLAPYTPSVNLDNPPNPGVANDAANNAYFNSVYNQTFGPHRAIVGPDTGASTGGGNGDPLDILLSQLSQVNVFGMPLFQNKVVVTDGRSLSRFAENGIDGITDLTDENFPIARTYAYNPGTPFNPAADTSNPGIVAMDVHIQTTLVSLDRFTQTTGAGAEPPSLSASPFIGPNPLAASGAGSLDAAPSVKLSLGGKHTEASLLYDTGGAATIISQARAADVGVRYKPGFEPGNIGGNDPKLQRFNDASSLWEDVGGAEQFELTLGGIGGQTKLAGLMLDNLLVRSMEGDANNDADYHHLNWLKVPVLIADISAQDEATNEVFTLDGIFGMNLLLASMFLDEPIDLLGLAGLPMAPGAFDWLSFDHTSATLGLSFDFDSLPISPSDHDGDGDVDANDLALIIAGFTGAGAIDKGLFNGDNDGDGDVDENDWLLALGNLDGGLSPTEVQSLEQLIDQHGLTGTIAVPEPTSLFWLTSAVALLCRRRRRA